MVILHIICAYAYVHILYVCTHIYIYNWINNRKQIAYMNTVFLNILRSYYKDHVLTNYLFLIGFYYYTAKYVWLAITYDTFYCHIATIIWLIWIAICDMNLNKISTINIFMKWYISIFIYLYLFIIIICYLTVITHMYMSKNCGWAA